MVEEQEEQNRMDFEKWKKEMQITSPEPDPHGPATRDPNHTKGSNDKAKRKKREHKNSKHSRKSNGKKRRSKRSGKKNWE
jgi:hypothetical protein